MGMVIPDKKYFRIGEVSRLTGLEPHVIRYWEKEFPRLRPVRADSRQRLYSREDILLIMNIRRLVHEERYTIAGAKKRLAGPGPASALALSALPPAQPVGPDPAREAPPVPPAQPRNGTRGGAQPELPLFPEESPPPPQAPESPGPGGLLAEIRTELGQIIRILS